MRLLGKKDVSSAKTSTAAIAISAAIVIRIAACWRRMIAKPAAAPNAVTTRRARKTTITPAPRTPTALIAVEAATANCAGCQTSSTAQSTSSQPPIFPVAPFTVLTWPARGLARVRQRFRESPAFNPDSPNSTISVLHLYLVHHGQAVGP